jgi:hypothetical protein
MTNDKLIHFVPRTAFYSSQSVVWIFIAILMGDALGAESPISRWLYFGIALFMSGCYSILTIMSALSKKCPTTAGQTI